MQTLHNVNIPTDEGLCLPSVPGKFQYEQAHERGKGHWLVSRSFGACVKEEIRRSPRALMVKLCRGFVRQRHLGKAQEFCSFCGQRE